MFVDPNYLKRSSPLEKTLQTKSILLLGPRRTGKSSLIRNELKPDITYSLLNSITYKELAIRPSLIREQLTPQTKLIVIDEIQKLPHLMDEVHLMIEEFQIRFLLTGSSARKLRRSYTSLMAGRARRMLLFPFTANELGAQFDLPKALLTGTLPSVYLSAHPWDELNGYVGDYLKEEIMAEALTRNIQGFARFLQTAASCNGQILNFEKIGQDAQVPARTIREYFSILEDTLIGTLVPPYQIKKGRRSISKSKFYFFDLGIVNSLLGRKSLSFKTSEFGELFETWVYLELKAYLEYTRSEYDLTFWRTQTGDEVDFIIGDQVAIEVKSTTMTSERHIKGLNTLAKQAPHISRYIVSLDTHVRILSDIKVLPYTQFIEDLWSHKIVSQ